MADMGFLPEVRRLLDQTPVRPPDAAVLGDARRRRRRARQPLPAQPRRATRSSVDGDAISDATHLFWRIDESERVERAAEAIKAVGPDDRVLPHPAPGRPGRQAPRQAGVDAVAIHGGRSQPQRDRALRDFTTGRVAGPRRHRRRRPRHPRRRRRLRRALRPAARPQGLRAPLGPHRPRRPGRRGRGPRGPGPAQGRHQADPPGRPRREPHRPRPRAAEEAPPRRLPLPQAGEGEARRAEAAERCEVRQAEQRNRETRIRSSGNEKQVDGKHSTSTAPSGSTTCARGSGS